MKNYVFIQYSPTMVIPDKIFNGLYNKEPAIIRFKGGSPVFVQFIENNSIYDAKGIMASNVEILIPAQQI